MSADERLIFMRQGETFAAADAIATARIEAGVIRALLTVAEWSDSTGRVVVSREQHSAFASELAAAIRGVDQ